MLFWDMISAINMDVALVSATFNNLRVMCDLHGCYRNSAKGDSGLGRSEAVIVVGHVTGYVPKYFAIAIRYWRECGKMMFQYQYK